MDYLPDYQNPCWMSSYKDPTWGHNPYQHSPYIVNWIKRSVFSLSIACEIMRSYNCYIEGTMQVNRCVIGFGLG